MMMTEQEYKTIDNLDVYPNDFGCLNWNDGVRACELLGNGWRLPTKDELNSIYINKAMIDGFTSDNYWSSSKTDTNNAWTQYFGNGAQGTYDDTNSFYVRPVRTVISCLIDTP
jgi:hypothetical protein